MADIELVIKISENIHTQIKSTDDFYLSADERLIKYGTPLPKGHGRLIDADKLKRIIQENDVLNMTGFNVRLCDINNTPTIIEADKEI